MKYQWAKKKKNNNNNNNDSTSSSSSSNTLFILTEDHICGQGSNLKICIALILILIIYHSPVVAPGPCQ